MTTDTLRTRIAAAIREVDDMRVCKLSNADIKFITDAVIREFKSELSSEYHKGYLDGVDEGWLSGWDAASGR